MKTKVTCRLAALLIAVLNLSILMPLGLSAADPAPVNTAIDIYGSRKNPLFFGVKAADAGLQAADQGDSTAGQFVGAAANGIALGESFGDSIGGGGLLQVAQIYVEQGFLVYDLVASGKLSELMDGIFGGLIDKTPYWNGFRLVINPTGQGDVAAVIDFDAMQAPAPAYDSSSGSFSGEASIPSFVRGLGPNILPVGVMLGIASQDSTSLKMKSLIFGSELFYLSAHALDITTLTNITAANRYFRSLDGVLFNASQTVLVRYPIAKGGGRYYVPDTVTNIADNAFYLCQGLNDIVIGKNVTRIGTNAFGASSLQKAYFAGNAPAHNGTAFKGTACEVVYLPGKTGWGTNYSGSTASLYAPFAATTANGAVTITGFYGWNNPASAAVIIPSELGGVPVRSIANKAFYGDWTITNVIVLDSITSIGEQAFYDCRYLASIRLSTNLTSMGPGVFEYCRSLSSLTIPKSVAAIPDDFAGACSNLYNVNIQATNLTSIGTYAFANCANLRWVDIPASVTSIGAYAFSGCSSVSIIVDPGNQAYSSDVRGMGLMNKAQTVLIHPYAQGGGAYTVPATVQKIDDNAFNGASYSTVVVPAGVTTLGAYAFSSCPNLVGVYFAGDAPQESSTFFDTSPGVIVYKTDGRTGWGTTYAGRPVRQWVVNGYVTNADNSLTLTSYNGPGGDVVLPENINGKSVTAIQAGLFAVPRAISSLKLPNSVTNIVANAFKGLNNLTNVVFGNNVISIGQETFSGCSSLQNLVIPDTVTSIGSGAFSECGLTNVLIGRGLTNLADLLFSSCNLQAVTIPMTIKHIGSSTFANNTFLQTVVIPASVSSLGANAFANCFYLENAYFQGTAPANDGTAFLGCNRVLVRYLPNTTGWDSQYGGRFTGLLPLFWSTNGGALTITEFTGSGRFSLFSSINGLPITGIGDFAFANCKGLTEVVIPAGITNIGAGPFLNCTDLTNLVVAAGNPYYVSVGKVLFNASQTALIQYPAGLGGTYQVPASVTTIGVGSFRGSGIQQVTIPAGVQAIGAQAFSSCRALTNLVVTSGNPNYITSGGVLFDVNRTVLVQYPGGFGGNYVVPATVTNLGPGSFAGSGVASVSIPTAVSVIAAGALANCGRLTNITVAPGNASFASVNGVLLNAARTALWQFPGGVVGSYRVGTNIAAIADLAFAGAALSDVTVSASVSSVGSGAFAGCARLLNAYFLGNAPANDGTAFVGSPTTVQYLASSGGWGTKYGGANAYEVPFYIADNGNDTLTVTGYKGTPRSLSIPSQIFGVAVVAIADHAFKDQTNLTWVSIGSSLTNIGRLAFYGCLSLDSVDLRNARKLNLSESAFEGCQRLRSVWLNLLEPITVTIGDYAFYGCTSLNTISLPGVIQIGNHAFEYCSSLTVVSFVNSVKSIGANAFANCRRLFQIELPASLTYLGSRVFANCGFPDNNLAIYASGNPPASDGTVFTNSYVTIITLPGTTWGATWNGATTVEIPAGFNYTIGPAGATITGLVSGYPYLVIPSSVWRNDGYYGQVPVVAIGANAFAGNQSITNVSFPETLVSIQDGAFMNCSNLQSATLPASLTSIGNGAFQNCVRLRGMNISQNVTNIGAYAFAGCPGETNLEFGAGLAFLGTNAFLGWTNLKTVYFNGNAPANNGSAFAGAANAALYVLPGSSGWGASYFGTPVAEWIQYLYRTNGGTITLQFYFGSQRNVTVPAVVNGRPVTALDAYIFSDRRDIDSVILPNSITSIQAYAFKYSSLTNIVLSTNLQVLESGAFYGSALRQVVLPDSLTNVSGFLFFNSALSNVVLPKNLLSIESSAFSYCERLSTITLPPTLQTIGDGAFLNSGLTSIALPRSLTSIADQAFDGCPLAGPIVIPPGVTFIGDRAFSTIAARLGPIYFEGNAPATRSYGAPFQGIYSYTVINGVTYNAGPGLAYYVPSTYGWGSTYSGMNTATWNPLSYSINGNTVTITGFSGSGGSLTVPGMIGGLPVTAIGAYAFASNATLTRIMLPDSITSVGTGAFARSTNLAAVEFRGNAPAVGANLFEGDNLSVYRLTTATGWGATLSGANVIAFVPTGALTIKIATGPSGAQWQVDGVGPWFSSGATATNLAVGSHSVSFSTVGGSWQTPGNLTLSVLAFQETTFPIPVPYYFIPFGYVTNGNGTGLTITSYLGAGGTVYIPAMINGMTVSGIAANAFASNSSLTSIVLPDTITVVGTNAFAWCSNLVSATVSSGITSLSGYVFANCPKLASVFFNGNAPATDGTIFNNDPLAVVYYPSAATGWTSTFSGRTASTVPFAFSVLSGNTIRITGYSGSGGNVTIPPTIGGLPVTDIYADVFANNQSLTQVTIPDSVKSIEFRAFSGCSNLQTVVLGTNVQWIGDLAFANCTSLASINFPDSLQVIYTSAFQNDGKLGSLNFGAGLTTIRDNAFVYCTNVTQIAFGNSLTNIGPGAFAHCTSLTRVRFPDSLREIQNGAFSFCEGLTNLSFGTNLSIIGDSAFFSCTGLRDLVFPPNIALGANAFAFCSHLQTVFFSGMMQYNIGLYVDTFYNDPLAVVYYPTFTAEGGYWRSPNFATSDYKAAVAYSVNPAGTVSIDHYVGGGNFTIPDTLGGLPVTAVASNAFSAYVNILTIGPAVLSLGAFTDANYGGGAINVDPANPNYCSVSGVLFDKAQTTLIRYPTQRDSFGSYTVPSTVTNIADHAFQGSRVRSVTLSPNITRIGSGAFAGAELAQFVNPAPDKLTDLGDGAFAGCASLTNFVTGANLAQIPPWTFANCTALQSVTLGGAVGSIGVGAFSNCVNLAAIVFPARLGAIGDGAFGNCRALTTLTIPAGLPHGTNYYSMQFGSGVFAGCTGLTSAYFLGNRPSPDYGNAFAGNNQVTAYYLGNSLGWSTTFGGAPTASYAPFGSVQVFFSPEYLAGAQWRVDGGPWMPSGATANNVPAGSHTISFAAVNNFNYVTPADQVVVVSNLSLTTASANYLPSPLLYTVTPTNTITITGVRELNADGFLVVPPTINGLPVTEIGDQAFMFNQSLCGLFLPPTMTRIGYNGFAWCTNLAFAVLNTNLLSIGDYAFASCKSLQTVVIPDSVTNLGLRAFNYCTALRSAQIGSGIGTVGFDTFRGDDQLTTLFFNGAPPTDANWMVAYYPQLGWDGYGPAIYYNPAAAGWEGVTNGQPADWTSLFSYRTNDAGGITINGFINSPYYQFPGLIVPASINGRPVTGIGPGAFYRYGGNYYYDVSEVLSLPPSITSVAAEAFFSRQLSQMVIGAAVTNIGDRAFGQLNGSALHVDPANPCFSSARGILYNKAQTELIVCPAAWGRNSGQAPLTVPNGVRRIADDAFEYLDYVTQLNLPASLDTLGERALNGYFYRLTNITVDPANRAFFATRDALFDTSATRLIKFFGKQETYYLPPTVAAIGAGAFKLSDPLNRVVIPPSVVRIGAEAFSSSSITSLIVPDTVTDIGAGAFMYSSVTNLVLPAGMKSIGYRLCFGCQQLRSINIPAGVTNIEEEAFVSTYYLREVVLPPGLLRIGARAFSAAGMASLVIPDAITEISESAFEYCQTLGEVTFGAGVTNIGAGAFYGDRALEVVRFNTNLVSIAANAFNDCQNLRELFFPASLTYLGADAFYNVQYPWVLFLGNAPAYDGRPFNSLSYGIYKRTGTTGWSDTFSNVSVTDYDSKFLFETNADGTLTLVGLNGLYTPFLQIPSQELGRRITGIGPGALGGNRTYSVATIPAGITNIAPDAFAGASIQKFVLEDGNPACRLVDDSLYDPTLTRLLAPVDRPFFRLPATVTNLITATFDACYDLNHISVDPANPSFSGLGGVLFDKPGTVLIKYPVGATALGYAVPASVATIASNAFKGCSLAGIRMPASVARFQPGAISLMYNLKAVYFEGAAPVFDAGAFADSNNAILYYLSPANAADFAAAGVSAQAWLSLFACVTNNGSSITIVGFNNPGNRTYVMFPQNGIGGLPIVDVGTAFAQTRDGEWWRYLLRGIALPSGLTNIVPGAFYNSGLEDVVMPTNITAIGDNAFGGCYLYQLNVPPGVAYIGDLAFADNDLAWVVIPASVKVLGNAAFQGNSLYHVELTNGLVSIGDAAFEDNEIEQIYLPNTLTNIGATAFKYNQLTALVIPPQIVEIQTETFSGNRLQSVSLPVGLRNIGELAFNNNGLATLVIPPGVTNIGASAFRNNNITSLELPGSLVSIGSLAFRYNELRSLDIPASVTSIEDAAFYGNYISRAIFRGDAPTNDVGTALAENYPYQSSTVAYYLAGTAGWGTSYGGVPTAMLTQSASGAANGDHTVTLTNFFGLGSVVVPTTLGGSPVTIIGAGAFASAGGMITSITMQNGIVGIASGAFAGCPALTTIVIPSTVTNIDVGVFSWLRGLTNIIVAPDNPVFSSVNGVLFDKSQTTLLAVGGGLTGNYVVPSTVTSIGADAFLGCSGLTNIVLPNGLTCIGDPAFGYCENLTTLTIPATVTFIGDYSFAYCPNLATIYFQGDAPPDNGTVFVGCDKATVYYLPSAFGFGPTFGSVPTQVMNPPMANPVIVYRHPRAALQISLASLAGSWTDPNQAYPVTLRSVGSLSTNRAPVAANSDAIFYSNTNDVHDQIRYSIVDSQGLIGFGVIQVVLDTNVVALPPVVADFPVEIDAGTPLVLPAAKVLARCSSPDGLALSLAAVSSASTNGGPVLLADGLITYTPVGAFTGVDIFSYTVSDSRGTQAVARVVVTVKAASGPSQNLVSLLKSGSAVTLRFAGIPGREYLVQTTTNSLPTTNWWNVSTNLTGSTGLVDFTDPGATNALQFYRVRQR